MGAAIDSNSTQAYYGEEATLGVQSPGPFYPLEPNTYSDWGVDTKSVTRSPINIARQQGKGTTTELSAVAGFQSDYTQSNLIRLLQGFFFADIRQKATTSPMNTAPTLVSSVAVGAYTLAAAVPFLPKHLLFASGFGAAGNNGVMLASAVAGAVVTAAPLFGGTTAVEAAPPAAAKIHAVGFQLSASAVLNGLAAGATVAFITDPTTDFTTLGLNVGEWLYIGNVGNASALLDFNFYGNASSTPIRGYARVSIVAQHTLTFDFVTFAGSGADATAAPKATSTGVNIFFGSMLKNENTLATIKRRSYTLPRYLGKGVANADQLEVLLGQVPDKFSLNAAMASKLTADISFVGIGATYSNLAMIAGTIQPFFNEKAFNTSRDIFASLLTVAGTESSSLFAFASNVKFSIDNGATVTQALGSASGFDITVGDFKVSGTADAYFNDIKTIAAVQNNADVGLTNIFARANAGVVFDIPLVTLGGGKLKIEKDKKVEISITQDGAANAAGYTAAVTNYVYLPDSAMSGYTGI